MGFNKRWCAALLALFLCLSGCGPVERPGGTEPLTAPTTAVSQPPETETPTTAATQPPETEPPEPEILPRWTAWIERNDDFVGWITVPGTIIDHPVVYCADNTFYLYHDFDTYSDPDGTIFLSREGGMLAGNRSWSLFGHHRKNGSMFSDLHKFKKLAFLQESPVFTFDSLYVEADYVIFSVFYMAGNETDLYFYYYPQSDFEDDAQFQRHIDQLTYRSIYDIPVEVTDQDQVVILTCCSYETDDLRIAVAGRRLREGEGADQFDTAAYTVAQRTLYPKKWYDKYGGKAPDGVLDALYGDN